MYIEQSQIITKCNTTLFVHSKHLWLQFEMLFLAKFTIIFYNSIIKYSVIKSDYKWIFDSFSIQQRNVHVINKSVQCQHKHGLIFLFTLISKTKVKLVGTSLIHLSIIRVTSLPNWIKVFEYSRNIYSDFFVFYSQCEGYRHNFLKFNLHY